MIEFVLLIPLLFVLLVNTVNFGGFLFAWVTVVNSARAGIQYYAASGAAVGSPYTPTTAQVTSLVTTGVSSLLNRASVTVRVCINKNSVSTCSGSGSSTPADDPEPATYYSALVDVGYTYQAFIPLFDFTGMAIHATLPGSAIHSRASMRVMQ